MNLAELREGVQDLGFDGEPPARLTRRINASYREIAGMKRWPWLERRNDATLLTTAGVASVSLAPITDLMWVDAVRMAQGTSKYDLTFLEPQDFQERAFPYTANGVPEYWTEQFTQILLDQPPSGVYTLSLDYLTTPPDLVDDGDAPLFDTTFHDVLVYGAALDLTLRQRDGFAETMHSRYDARMTQMIRAYNLGQRQDSDQVKPYWKSSYRY